MPLSVWRALVYLFTDYGLDDYVWLVDGAINAMTLDHVCIFRVYFNLPMPKGTAMPIDISRLYNILRRFSSRRGFLSYRFLNGSVEVSTVSDNNRFKTAFSRDYGSPNSIPVPDLRLANMLRIQARELGRG
jgi:hypothetical protein